MNTSRLKSLLITACCLVFALFTKSQAMDDNRSGSQEIIQCKIGHSEIYLDSLKQETDNSSLHAMLPLNQDEDENLIASWVSYVTSPIKAVIHGTYNISDFSVKHPTQTIITSLIIGAQFTAMVSAVQIPSWDCINKCMALSSPNNNLDLLVPFLVNYMLFGGEKLGECIVWYCSLMCALGFKS